MNLNKVSKAAIVTFLMIALLGSGIVISQNQKRSVQAASETVTFTISDGDGFISILNQMEEQGIIRSAFFTRLFSKYANTSFIPGNYSLDKSWSSDEILAFLANQSNAIVDISVTILPQDWAKEAAGKIAAATSLTADDILTQWNDDEYLRTLMVDYPFLTEEILNDQAKVKLEGYLYPDTYRFYVDTTVDQVTRKILDNTNLVYQSLKSDFDQSTLSIHEVFTLASIVGFEASTTEDRELIAGIFYNRLNIDMKLQSSVTVCYALYDYEHWSDCETNPDLDSPYNTYKNYGLPIGPILNPTTDSLYATLHPKKSDYFYFLADVTTGTVYYAITYEEHLQNKEKYLGG